MLIRLLWSVLTVAFLSGLGVLSAPTASAAPCTSTISSGDFNVVVEIECATSSSTSGSSGGSGGRSSASRVCTTQLGREVPCTSEYGTWVASRACYAQRVETQPASTDPVWGGRTSGAIYSCTQSPDGGTVVPLVLWLAADPATIPDPRVLSARAVAAMALQAPEIGLVPEPGAVGVIGLPVWMWVANPGPSVTGPITRSASEGGYTVTATATVARVVWDMGDGTSVTCEGPGTPYQDSYGTSSSPTCGHTYLEAGHYTVTATSFWDINWTGIGETGTLTRSYSNSVQIEEAEVQVIGQR